MRIRINDDQLGPEVDQFHNAMACSESGTLVAVWYDQRIDPNHTKFDVFAAYSYDGNRSWTTNHRVSSVSIDPALLFGSLGEYIGVACVRDKVVAAWTDTRGGNQDIWSASWNLPLTDPRLLTQSGQTLSCGDSLHWATAWKENEDRYLFQLSTSDLFLTNEIVLSGFTDASSFELPPGLPDTTLYWRVKAYKAPRGTTTDSTDFTAASSLLSVGCQCSCDCHRDPMCDGATDIIDVVSTVDVAFGGTPASADPSASCPYIQTDVNCDDVVNVVDVVLMINIVYRHAILGPGLCGLCE